MSLSLFPGCRILLSLVMVAGSVTAQTHRPATNAPNQSPISASFVNLQPAGLMLSGYLAKPGGASGLPAVLLIPAAGRLTGPVLQAARDFALHNFVALAVDYDPDHVSQESDLVQSVANDRLSLRLNVALDWLARQRPLADPQRISAIGWGGGAARVLRLGQSGRIRSGVMIADEPCRAPQDLTAAPVARMLVIVGGCGQERGQELQRNIASTSSEYRVRIFQGRLDSFPQQVNETAGEVWVELYRFLKDAASADNTAQETAGAYPNSVSTIRDIMRVINSDDGVRGTLARLISTSSAADIQWDLARSHAAILVDASAWLLPRRPPKGSPAAWRGHVTEYRAATETLLHAVEQHDLPGAQQALARLPQACGACHMDHR